MLGHQTVARQIGHALVGGVGQLSGGFGALPLHARHLDFLRARAVLGLVGHGLRGLLGRGRLLQLGAHLGAVQAHQQRTALDALALAHGHIEHARRHLAGDVGLARFHLALKQLGGGAGGLPQAPGQHGQHAQQHEQGDGFAQGGFHFWAGVSGAGTRMSARAM